MGFERNWVQFKRRFLKNHSQVVAQLRSIEAQPKTQQYEPSIYLYNSLLSRRSFFVEGVKTLLLPWTHASSSWATEKSKLILVNFSLAACMTKVLIHPCFSGKSLIFSQYPHGSSTNSLQSFITLLALDTNVCQATWLSMRFFFLLPNSNLTS